MYPPLPPLFSPAFRPLPVAATTVSFRAAHVPDVALMQPRAAAVAFPESNSGLAEVKVWVNLWCYSRLGSWYELPYINPPRVLGRGWVYDPTRQQPGILSLILHTVLDLPCPLGSILTWPYTDLSLCSKLQWYQWFLSAREGRIWLTGCTLHNSGVRDHSSEGL